MRLPSVFQSIVLAVMFLGAGGFPAVAPEAAQLYAATELKAVNGGHFVVKADINGSDVMVLVDTGATTVALSYEDAQTVGLHPNSLTYDVPVSTANGVVNAARISLSKIEIDGVRVRDVPGMVLPEGAMRGSLLGMSFLSRLSGFKVEDGVLYLKN